MSATQHHTSDHRNGAARPWGRGLDPTASISFHVTFFADYAAKTKREDTHSLRSLAQLIETTSGDRKETLPWLKLARFGDKRTEEGRSLRHNANVVAISGIEADYDAGEMSIADAAEIIREAGVLALLYASPSHAEDEPHWRILCPTSVELPPDRRAALVARLNGLFSGVLARESFVLSQSFYFGAVRDNPSHIVEVLSGTPIDLLTGLDAGAIGPRPEPAIDHAARASHAYTPLSEKRIDGFVRGCLDKIRAAPDGGKHIALLGMARSLGGVQERGGFSDDEGTGWMMAALPASVEDWKRAEKTARDGLAYGRREAIELPDRERPAPPNGTGNGHGHCADEGDDWPGPSADDMRRQAHAEGTDEARAREGPNPDPEPEAPGNTLPFVTFAELEDGADEVQDFVEGLLTRGSMSVVYGESNCGKSFFATDMALRIASGMSWRDREIEAGGVLYLALEGTHGIRNRITAFKRAHDLQDADIPFGLVTIGVNLLDPNAHVGLVIATVRELTKRFEQGVALIVVDTLFRALGGGNENAADDMGLLVLNGDRLRHETGAHVMWIHHSGKDAAKGARGHSSLRAATDTEIEIVADGTTRIARTMKQRDLECSGEFTFTLKVVELGTNRRSKPITSCVVEHGEAYAASAATAVRRLTGDTKRAFEVLADLVATEGQAGYSGTPSGILSVPEKWWRERFYAGAKAGAEPEAKKRAFRRAADFLVNQHRVGMGAGRVWLPVPPTQRGT